ncbi:hypothetical protein LI142_18760 [Eubacterium limosum]|uniref:HipA family kinase n=1 Tax=Eubacterium limosum TaxID=1736 RepID=UPI001D06F7E8|nr:HipA family kinase [Eubacterium limosum]MCB6571545.1 hypothetical protein [Eubacterium limosum]
MGYKHIKQIERPMGNGCTEPFLAITDDNVQVVIKLFNNIEGNLVLFNEYVCYHLAKTIGLRIPRGDAFLVDKTTMYKNGVVAPANFGVCYGSEYMEHSLQLNHGIIRKLLNLDDYYKMILFDHLVFNTDRNIGNLLTRIMKKEQYLYVIDHTHVFKNQAIWCSSDLERGMDELDFSDNSILCENERCYNYFFQNVGIDEDKLKIAASVFDSKINYDIIKRIIESVPNEWRCSEDDANSLARYLSYRLAHINDYCDLILNYNK